MELLMIILGIAYIAYSLFTYFSDGLKPLGDLSLMNHKWLFSLWIVLWAVPYLIIGIHLDSFLLILSASLFLSLTIHPFVSRNNDLILYTGAAGGILIALLALGLNFNLWVGLPLLGVMYIIIILKDVKTASFYLSHLAFLILYISLWMV